VELGEGLSGEYNSGDHQDIELLHPSLNDLGALKKAHGDCPVIDIK
jgi:hypothetical protein